MGTGFSRRERVKRGRHKEHREDKGAGALRDEHFSFVGDALSHVGLYGLAAGGT